jgi:hypothetical protein
MASFTTEFFYELKEHGQSGNAKVAELVTNSTSTNTEASPDGTLMPGEEFTAVFADQATQDAFGGVYTYVGHDAAVPGIVATKDGESFLFSGNPDLEGETLNDIVEEETPVCFLAGTLIATPTGEVPVECLNIGDLVLTADGRAVPVKWIGRQTIVLDPMR